MFKRLLLFMIILSVGLIGCGGDEPAASMEAPAEEYDTEVESYVEYVEVEGEVVVVEVTRVASESIPTAAATAGVSANAGSASNREAAQSTKRLIIKEGQIELLVEDSTQVIAEVSNLTAATGGFIVQQRVWDTNGYTYATIKLSVPVIEFERAMNVLRGMGEVVMDAAVGQDVTDEYIDLESRLGNLQATQDRLRSFLEEASKIEDVLEINKELTKVEEELSIILGRMNYLADRAAFSTITLTINPRIPTPTPSMTPTATPTVTPTPVPQWRPSETVRDAGANLQTAGQNTADFLIWNLIACGPWLLLLALLGYVALRAWRRFGSSLDVAVRPQRREEAPPEETTE